MLPNMASFIDRDLLMLMLLLRNRRRLRVLLQGRQEHVTGLLGQCLLRRPMLNFNLIFDLCPIGLLLWMKTIIYVLAAAGPVPCIINCLNNSIYWTISFSPISVWAKHMVQHLYHTALT